MNIITFSAIYLTGYVLSFIMQRTEIASEKQPYTFGDRLLISSLSLLSFVWVVVILIVAWVKQIKNTGYFNEEIKPKTEEKLITKKPVLN
jgi:hypothetical protein